MMLLALSKRKRAALEIVFCFTYCKMNQRFILWRLLFCWYWHYDRSLYILNMCVIYIWCSMWLWWLGRISGWLFMFSRTTRASRHMKATSLPVQTGESKSLSAFMQTSVAASAAGRRGLWEMFQETFFSLFRVATFKDSPAPTGNWGFFSYNLKNRLWGF